MVAPSQPGQDFASADVRRATLGTDEVGRILLQYIQQSQPQGGIADRLSALLAALRKSQAPGNVRFVITSVTSGNPTGAFLGPARIQQILLENPLRHSLILFRIEGGGVDNKPYFLFENNSLNPVNLATTDFNAKLKFALPSTLTSTTSTGLFPFFPCPINPVTVMTAVDSFARALIIEGI